MQPCVWGLLAERSARCTASRARASGIGLSRAAAGLSPSARCWARKARARATHFAPARHSGVMCASACFLTAPNLLSPFATYTADAQPVGKHAPAAAARTTGGYCNSGWGPFRDCRCSGCSGAREQHAVIHLYSARSHCCQLSDCSGTFILTCVQLGRMVGDYNFVLRFSDFI